MLREHDERRDFRRMTIDAPVTVSLGELQLQGICKDLSATGMLIHLSDPHLSAGAKIRVLLETPDARFPSLDVDARVLRVSEENGTYIVATEFAPIH